MAVALLSGGPRPRLALRTKSNIHDTHVLLSIPTRFLQKFHRSIIVIFNFLVQSSISKMQNRNNGWMTSGQPSYTGSSNAFAPKAESSGPITPVLFKFTHFLTTFLYFRSYIFNFPCLIRSFRVPRTTTFTKKQGAGIFGAKGSGKGGPGSGRASGVFFIYFFNLRNWRIKLDRKIDFGIVEHVLSSILSFS